MGALVVPDAWIQMFVPKQQHIGQLEALAGLVPLYNCPGLLRRARLLHFVDNSAALSGFVGKISACPDSACIFALFQIVRLKLEISYWAEHVDSEANCSDEPSRLGDSAPRARALGCEPCPACLPDVRELMIAPAESLAAWLEQPLRAVTDAL